MSNIAIGTLMFVIMLVLVLIGVPIIVAMLSTSLVGIWWIGGSAMVISQFTAPPFNLSASYSYAILPLFTLLGLLASDTGIASGAFYSMRTFLAKFKGSLLYTTIAGSAIFGACSGNASAGSIVFAKLALPEMDKYGYDKHLSLGCVSASSALSILIPPSVPICQMAILAGYSVGNALMYGLSTGILTLLVMFIVVKVIITVSPTKVPPVTEEDKHIPTSEKIRSLRLLIPILVLFVFIIGGTYLGWFHPTVAGAVGAFVTVIYALVKRMPIKKILHACWEAATMYAGVYLIIVSGTMFSRMISISGLTNALVNLVVGAAVPGFVVLAFVIVFYLIAGCIMDILAIVVVTVPIIFPILVSGMGYDPYVLIMIGVLVSAIGAITPPIGIQVFTMSNVTRIKASEIFKGVWPFVVSELIVVILIAIFPILISWLPNLISFLS